MAVAVDIATTPSVPPVAQRVAENCGHGGRGAAVEAVSVIGRASPASPNLAAGGDPGAGNNLSEASYADGARRNLAAAASSFATVLAVARTEDVEDRLAQCFLGATQFERARLRVGVLMANILAAALDGFLTSAGIAVAGVIRPPESGRYGTATIGPPRRRVIETGPTQTSTVYDEAMLFLGDRQGARAVLTISEYTDDGAQAVFQSGELEPQTFFAQWREYALAHAYLRGQRFYADGTMVKTERTVRLADVRLSAANRRLIERLVLDFPNAIERYRRHGLPAKRGVLLAGPPGTGKTLLCRALCHELPATFIWVTPRHMKEEEHVSGVWEIARALQPTVLLLEDIDVYAESRDDHTNSGILGELMVQMDGPDANDGILTLATTNRLEVVEQALRNRPGRFDRVIHVGALEEDGRRELLRRRLGHMVSAGMLEHVVTLTEEFTGAQVDELAKTVIDLAADEDGEGDASDAAAPAGALTSAAIEAAVAELTGRPARRVGFAGG
jgi:hypothetical protein